MKVRWTEDSVRLRITPAELAALEAREPVGVSLRLPGGGVWSAMIEPGVETPTRLEANAASICIYLHEADRRRLSHPEAEGIYFAPPTADSGVPRFLIEKDFPCVHPRAIHAEEPTTETFAAPPGFDERKGVA